MIRYTVNGTPPSETNGLVYSAPIPVTNTTTLRAVAFKPGWQPSGSDAQTYIFLDSILKQTGAGFPATWGGTTPDYAMDPAVVNDPRYAPTIRDDMKSLPVMSIVMDPADLFGAGGIYANPTARGPAWERACSVEYFYPDGSQNGFQVNCGIRLHGGASRDLSGQLQPLRHRPDVGAAVLERVANSEHGAVDLEVLGCVDVGWVEDGPLEEPGHHCTGIIRFARGNGRVVRLVIFSQFTRGHSG